MKALANWLAVKFRAKDPHAPVFEVVRGNGGWFYHQRVSGRITNVSESYYSKSNAKRAAYAQAVRIPGSTVRVLE